MSLLDTATVSITVNGWGKRGYYQITPPGNYVACSVYELGAPAGAAPIYTQIKHVGDDPLHAFLTPDNAPWLPQAEIDAINLPHRAIYRHRLAVATTCDRWFGDVLNAAAGAMRKQPVRRAAFESGYTAPVDIVAGGFVPSGCQRPASLASLVHHELIERDQMRREGRFADADLIKRVVIGGGVAIEDGKLGTFYWYPTS